MEYTVDYYVHVDNKDDAIRLVTHRPFAGDRIPTAELSAYAGPVIAHALALRMAGESRALHAPRLRESARGDNEPGALDGAIAALREAPRVRRRLLAVTESCTFRNTFSRQTVKFHART